MTLTEQVRNILMQDDIGDGPIGRAHAILARVGADGEPLTPWELDVCDWGIVYGIAFGLAWASENDGGSPEDLAARATDVALAVLHTWGDGFTRRPDALRAQADATTGTALVQRIVALLHESLEQVPQDDPMRERLAQLDRRFAEIEWAAVLA